MINCNKCKGSVSRNMKHSLKSNECPFCGSHLLGNEDLKVCKEISYDLLKAGFRESEVYDMSIFIYNTYLKEAYLLPSSDKEEVEGESFFEEEVAPEIPEEGRLESSFDSIPEDEDEDDRVTRLRELARSNPILNKKGASVRRITDWSEQ